MNLDVVSTGLERTSNSLSGDIFTIERVVMFLLGDRRGTSANAFV